jgi:hypothetical protein
VGGVRREPRADLRVVPGDQPGARHGRDLGEQVVSPVHRGEVGEDRVGAILLDLLVVVQRVGGEGHGPRVVGDGDDELARGVPADLNQLNAGSELGALARRQREPALLAGVGEERDLGGLGVQREVRAPSDRRGPEVVLGLAHHDLGGRELVKVPGVVPVRVRDDHGAHRRLVDAEGGQHVGRRVLAVALSAAASLRREPRVDERDRPAVLADDPEVVVHADGAVRLVVDVVVEEGLRPWRDPAAVPDREHFPGHRA